MPLRALFHLSPGDFPKLQPKIFIILFIKFSHIYLWCILGHCLLSCPAKYCLFVCLVDKKGLVEIEIVGDVQFQNVLFLAEAEAGGPGVFPRWLRHCTGGR